MLFAFAQRQTHLLFKCERNNQVVVTMGQTNASKRWHRRCGYANYRHYYFEAKCMIFVVVVVVVDAAAAACCRKENDVCERAEKTKLEFETTTERKKEARKKTLSKLSLIVVCRLPESIVVAGHGGFLIWSICCKREFFFFFESLRKCDDRAKVKRR